MTLPTIRLAEIIHAQAIRLPGHAFNSIQIDGKDAQGNLLRIVLEPPVLKAMVRPVTEERADFGLDRR